MKKNNISNILISKNVLLIYLTAAVSLFFFSPANWNLLSQQAPKCFLGSHMFVDIQTASQRMDLIAVLYYILRHRRQAVPVLH